MTNIESYIVRDFFTKDPEYPDPNEVEIFTPGCGIDSSVPIYRGPHNCTTKNENGVEFS